jgi:hypothetical protein
MSQLSQRPQFYVFPNQLTSAGGAAATLDVVEFGEVFLIRLLAVTPGLPGNSISFETIVAGDNTVLSVSVVGSAITVNCGTDGGGATTTTLTDMVNALEATPAFNALCTITLVANMPDTIFVFGFPTTFLHGGTGGGSSLQQGLTIKIDPDAPFLLTGVVVWNSNPDLGNQFDGQAALRFQRPDGRYIQRALTSTNLLFPGNQYNQGLTPNVALRSPIRPGVLYPPNSVITLDILGLPTDESVLQLLTIVFCGINLYQAGSIWDPKYPAKWKPRTYLDNLTIPSYSSFNGPSVNNIFNVQNDADFVWQAGVYTDFGAGTSGDTPIAQLRNLGVIFRDYTYKPYMNAYVPIGLVFPFLSAQAPGYLYPEIYIPRNGQMLFDIAPLTGNEAPPAGPPITVVLGLKGMKVYPQ